MKIAVIGAGAMGSLFGGLLAKKADVVLYSHNLPYVEAVNKSGLIMTQLEKRDVVKVRATSDPADIGEVDVALIYCKNSGTRKAVEDALVSAVGENTIVLTLQNGIGNVEVIREYVPADRIVYGFSTLTSDVKAPGHIEMTTLKRVWTYMWPVSGKVTPELEALNTLMNDVGLDTKIAEDIDRQIWLKLMINCSENTLCAILRMNVSELVETPASFAILKQIVYEVSDVARAKGIQISRDQGLDHVMRVTESVPGHVPSMVFDILKKKKTEIDSLNFAVVAEGNRLHVPTPMVETVGNMIRAMEQNYETRFDHH